MMLTQGGKKATRKQKKEPERSPVVVIEGEQRPSEEQLEEAFEEMERLRL
jgi:uncharacterized FlaG/YvyC family protein